MSFQKTMKYKKLREYKYVTAEDYRVKVALAFLPYKSEYLEIGMAAGLENYLIIKKGYQWDGASGPAIDTKNFMIASLVHDALYQLIREGVIPAHKKEWADSTMKQLCVKAGMNKLRAWWLFRGVHRFGASSCRSNVIEVSLK